MRREVKLRWLAKQSAHRGATLRPELLWAGSASSTQAIVLSAVWSVALYITVCFWTNLLFKDQFLFSTPQEHMRKQTNIKAPQFTGDRTCTAVGAVCAVVRMKSCLKQCVQPHCLQTPALELSPIKPSSSPDLLFARHLPPLLAPLSLSVLLTLPFLPLKFSTCERAGPPRTPWNLWDLLQWALMLSALPAIVCCMTTYTFSLSSLTWTVSALLAWFVGGDSIDVTS